LSITTWKKSGEVSEQHLQQEAAMPHQAGDEPGEVEAPQFTRQRSAAADQDQFADPCSLEVVQGFHDRRRGHSLGADESLQQHALSVALRQDGQAAVAHQRHGGQWRQGQPLCGHLQLLGIQADLLGREQQVGGGWRLRRPQAELMAEVLRVCCNLMEAREQAQGLQGVGTRDAAAAVLWIARARSCRRLTRAGRTEHGVSSLSLSSNSLRSAAHCICVRLGLTSQV